MIKEEYRGQKVYSKRLRGMITICEENEDILRSDPRLALYLKKAITKVTVQNVGDKTEPVKQTGTKRKRTTRSNE